MSDQPFDSITDLLPAVEKLVLEAHRSWYESRGRTDWSPPTAYHWLRYEDPDPIARLQDGIRRLQAPAQIDESSLSSLESRVEHRRGA
ncbi:MAG TPA: hypothetical protein VNG93_04265 [Candidatus Dormibacteraeota bacterium]|nr:hypothetical protein [Candidatus Dormibacteraeota bacterium]